MMMGEERREADGRGGREGRKGRLRDERG